MLIDHEVGVKSESGPVEWADSPNPWVWARRALPLLLLGGVLVAAVCACLSSLDGSLYGFALGLLCVGVGMVASPSVFWCLARCTRYRIAAGSLVMERRVGDWRVVRQIVDMRSIVAVRVSRRSTGLGDVAVFTTLERSQNSDFVLVPFVVVRDVPDPEGVARRLRDGGAGSGPS